MLLACLLQSVLSFEWGAGERKHPMSRPPSPTYFSTESSRDGDSRCSSSWQWNTLPAHSSCLISTKCILYLCLACPWEASVCTTSVWEQSFCRGSRLQPGSPSSVNQVAPFVPLWIDFSVFWQVDLCTEGHRALTVFQSSLGGQLPSVVPASTSALKQG